MERRKVLAAISAAIATPLSAVTKDPRYERTQRGDPEWPSIGLTPFQVEVREVLKQRLLTALDNEAGPAAFADLWVLTDALEWYGSGDYGGQFAGLLNCIEDAMRRDRRFVAVPEEIHKEVASYIEQRKAGPSMAYSPAFLRFQSLAGPEDQLALDAVLIEYCQNHHWPDNHFCEAAGRACFSMPGDLHEEVAAFIEQRKAALAAAEA